MQDYFRPLFLPVEITAREMNAKQNICAIAVKYGYTVYIGSKSSVARLAMKIGFGVYLGKDHGPQSFSQYENLASAGVDIYCMDEEGFIFHSKKEYSKRVDPRIITMSKGIFLWGENQRRTVDTILGHKHEHLFLTGNPRFDLLSPIFRDFYPVNNLIVDDLSPYILISSMFAAGNWEPLMYGTSDYLQHQYSRGKIKDEQDERFYIGKASHTKQLVDEYIKAITYLSEKLPNQRFVIRPHPDERHKTWHDAFAGHKNVEVIFEGAATDWISRAVCLIYTGCTTGVESWAMNVPSINYRPLGQSPFESQLPNRFGVPVGSLPELLSAVTSCINHQHTLDSIDEEDAKYHVLNIRSGGSAESMVTVFLSRSREAWRRNSFIRRVRILLSLLFTEVLIAKIKRIGQLIGLGSVTSEVLGVRKQKFFLPPNSQFASNIKFLYLRYFNDDISLRISRFGSEIVEIKKKQGVSTSDQRSGIKA